MKTYFKGVLLTIIVLFVILLSIYLGCCFLTFEWLKLGKDVWLVIRMVILMSFLIPFCLIIIDANCIIEYYYHKLFKRGRTK